MFVVPNWQFLPLLVLILDETISVVQLWIFDMAGIYSGPIWYYKHKSSSFWLCYPFICSTIHYNFIYFRQSLQAMILLAHLFLWIESYLWEYLVSHWSQGNFIVLISLLANTDCLTASFYLQFGQFKWFAAIRSFTHF